MTNQEKSENFVVKYSMLFTEDKIWWADTIKKELLDTKPSAQALKIDRTKLRTVENYSKLYGLSKPTIYKRIGDGTLTKILIDGVTFVLVE